MKEMKKKQGKLRKGYTTGSCAAAAATGALFLLLGEKFLSQVSLVTPSQVSLVLPITNHEKGTNWASCAVKKDSGDDPDVTNGMLIFAKVEQIPCGIELDGGKGIGRVTKKGMDQPVGNAAINSVPRQMITKQVQLVCRQFGYTGGIRVTIFAPQGEEIAKKTFNARLGICGGISILGSSGIVEPMSEQALVDSIAVEMRMKRANGMKNFILTPGNYGQNFLKENMGIDLTYAVKISNFIGRSLDIACELDVEGVLLVGHIGKLIKMAGGIMQTHSAMADCRLELLGVHAVLAGGSRSLLEKILSCATTEAALELLKQKNILEQTMQSVLAKIVWYLQKRTGGTMEIAVVLFSEKMGSLGQTENVSKMLEKIQEE